MTRGDVRRPGSRVAPATYLLHVLLLVALWSSGALAAPGPRDPGTTRPARQVILIALDRVAWSELRQTDMPNFQALVNRGAVGLMNSRAKGDADPNGSWVMLGAGQGAVGGRAAAEAGDDPRGGASAGSASPRAKPRGGVRQTGVTALRQLNQRARTGAIPGLLGETLHRAGRRTAVIGNGDLPGEPRRLGAVVAMDAQGRVDEGSVELAPGADSLSLLSVFANCRDASLVVIDYGETARADETAPSSLFRPSAAKQASLRQADRFLGDLASRLDLSRTLLIVCSPNGPAYGHSIQRHPSFVLMAGGGIPHGLLESGSTRRVGLLAAIDIPATVLSWLQVPAPVEMIGRPAEVKPTARPDQYLDELDSRLTRTHGLIYRAVPPFLVGEFALVLVMAGLALGQSVRRSGPRRWRRWPLLFGMMFPLGLLVAPRVSLQPGLHLLTAGAVVLLITAVLVRLPGLPGLAWAGFLLSGVPALDALFGGPLMGRSILGGDPVTGGRFYGMDNDWMGFAVAGAAVGAGAWLQARSGKGQWPMTVFLLALLAVIGLPFFGANWGGGVTAAAAFTALAVARRGRRVWRGVGWIAAAMVVTGFGLLAVDAARTSGAQSHLGQLWRQAAGRGAQVVWGMALRKTAVNLSIWGYSWFALVGGAVLLGLLAVLWSRLSAAGALRSRPAFRAGLVAALVGMVVGGVFNDSGAAVAAGGLLVTMLAAGHLMLVEEADAPARP